MATFEEKLAEYNTKLEAEFTVDLGEEDSYEMAKRVRKSIIPWVPVFLTTIAQLAAHAKSEGVRLKAAERGLEIVYGKGTPIGDMEDGLNKLIRELQEGGNSESKVGYSPHEE
jgi:hypothetical protein